MEIKVRTVSAQHSYLEEGEKFFWENKETTLKIISVDHDGIKLTDGGDSFIASLKIDSQEEQV